jgi:thiamine-monophosphate kinase
MTGQQDEFSLIARYFAPLSQSFAGAMSLSDDAAFVTPEPGKVLVVTTDAIVEGVHFLSNTPADLVARKLVRVNLSDLAAKGAKPFAVLFNAVFPKTLEESWIASFSAGLKQDFDQFGISLIGGDTVSTPGPLCLALTALGWATIGMTPHRSVAKAGDDIWVSGTIGDGGAGLLVAKGNFASDYLRDRYQLPQPRVELGQAIAGLVNAAMDVSDGLIQDLGHICAASNLGAELLLDHIPLSQAYRETGLSVLDAASMGDDYELLFTASPHQSEAIQDQSLRCGIDIARIGRMIEGKGVCCHDAKGAIVTPTRTGWQHFDQGNNG